MRSARARKVAAVRRVCISWILASSVCEATSMLISESLEEGAGARPQEEPRRAQRIVGGRHLARQRHRLAEFGGRQIAEQRRHRARVAAVELEYRTRVGKVRCIISTAAIIPSARS